MKGITMNFPTTLSLKKLTLKHLISASILAISLPLAGTALAHDGHTASKDNAKCERGHFHQGKHHGFKHQGFKHSGFKHHGFKQAHQDGVPHYLHGLVLTQAQQDQLFALRHEQAPVLREQQKERRALYQALREASQAPAFDDAKVQQIATGLANLEREQVLMRARNQAKIMALLTPEQREKAQAFKQERAQRKHTEGTGYHHHHGDQSQRKM
jgi:Spy/CpxP family protein refolding chaperone